MKQCLHCQVYNENNTARCRICNHAFPVSETRVLGFIRWFMLIFLVVGLFYVLLTPEINQDDFFNRKSPQSVGFALLSSAGFKVKAQKMVVEGNVKNISGLKLTKVYSIVSWYNKKKKKLSEQSSLLLNLPLPDQGLSSLRVVTAYIEGMETYDISFIDAYGKHYNVLDHRER